MKDAHTPHDPSNHPRYGITGTRFAPAGALAVLLYAGCDRVPEPAPVVSSPANGDAALVDPRSSVVGPASTSGAMDASALDPTPDSKLDARALVNAMSRVFVAEGQPAWDISTESDVQRCVRPLGRGDAGAAEAGGPKEDLEACFGVAPSSCESLVTTLRDAFADKPPVERREHEGITLVTVLGARTFSWHAPDRPRFRMNDAAVRAFIVSRGGSCAYFRFDGKRTRVVAIANEFEKRIRTTLRESKLP